MRFFQYMLLLAMISTTQIYAALPPFYQSLKEYQDLFSDPTLSEKLTTADIIQNVQRNETGFLIETSKHTLRVDVVNDPQKMPGPTKFHFMFHDAVAK